MFCRFLMNKKKNIRSYNQKKNFGWYEAVTFKYSECIVWIVGCVCECECVCVCVCVVVGVKGVRCEEWVRADSTVSPDFAGKS